MQAVRTSAIAIAAFISIAMIFNISTALRHSQAAASEPLKLSYKPTDWQKFNEWGVFESGKSTVAYSALPWKLKGIFYSTSSQASQVILSTNGHEDATYHVGDPIIGDARVQQILENAVVISRQGRLERLSLINLPPVG